MSPKLDIYRRKLETSLAARFYLRFHVSLILLFAIVCGWLTDVALLNLGLTRRLWRYPLAVVGSYAGFLAGVWLWIEYSGIREYLKLQKQNELIGDDVPPASGASLSPSDLITGSAGVPEGCLIVLIGLTPILFFGGYIWANAALVFSEIVLELFLVAGLIRGLGRAETSGWVLGAMNATYWSFMFTFVVSILLAYSLEQSFPSAVTLADVMARL